jgi:hypothetical protein
LAGARGGDPMTNELIEELEKIADELNDLIKNPRFCVLGFDPQLMRLKAKIRELNDLIRKINEELE